MVDDRIEQRIEQIISLVSAKTPAVFLQPLPHRIENVASCFMKRDQGIFEKEKTDLLILQLSISHQKLTGDDDHMVFKNLQFRPLINMNHVFSQKRVHPKMFANGIDDSRTQTIDVDPAHVRILRFGKS